MLSREDSTAHPLFKRLLHLRVQPAGIVQLDPHVDLGVDLVDILAPSPAASCKTQLHILCTVSTDVRLSSCSHNIGVPEVALCHMHADTFADPLDDVLRRLPRFETLQWPRCAMDQLHSLQGLSCEGKPW